MGYYKKLNATWFIDIDGVIFPHNAYLSQTEIEKPLPGVIDFFRKLDPDDKVVLVTARAKKYELLTINSLNRSNIRYNFILFDLPTGPRVLINDKKESGMDTAYSINVERNVGLSNISTNTDKNKEAENSQHEL